MDVPDLHAWNPPAGCSESLKPLGLVPQLGVRTPGAGLALGTTHRALHRSPHTPLPPNNPRAIATLGSAGPALLASTSPTQLCLAFAGNRAECSACRTTSAWRRATGHHRRGGVARPSCAALDSSSSSRRPRCLGGTWGSRLRWDAHRWRCPPRPTSGEWAPFFAARCMVESIIGTVSGPLVSPRAGNNSLGTAARAWHAPRPCGGTPPTPVPCNNNTVAICHSTCSAPPSRCLHAGSRRR